MGIVYDNSITNGGNIPIIIEGNHADIPAPGIPGREYHSVDTNEIYVDTGTSWEIFIGAGLNPGLTAVLGTTNQIVTTPGITGTVVVSLADNTVMIGAASVSGGSGSFSLADQVTAGVLARLLVNSGVFSLKNASGASLLSINLTTGAVTFLGNVVFPSLTLPGTTAQYVRGDGSLATFPPFPSLTGFVPYTGATNDLNLGTHSVVARNATMTNLTVISAFNADGGASINGNVSLSGGIFLLNSGFQITFLPDTLTTDRTQLLPDKDGTVLLDSSLIGTVKQVILTSVSGDVQLSLPQNIASDSDVVFASMTLHSAAANDVILFLESNDGLGFQFATDIDDNLIISSVAGGQVCSIDANTLDVAFASDILTPEIITPSWSLGASGLNIWLGNDSTNELQLQLNATPVIAFSETDVIVTVPMIIEDVTAAGVSASSFIKNSSPQTVVAATVAGSVTFSQPEQGSSYKKVIIYCNSANGIASYTFPEPFTVVPTILKTTQLNDIFISVLNTTTVTVNTGGSIILGLLIVEGY